MSLFAVCHAVTALLNQNLLPQYTLLYYERETHTRRTHHFECVSMSENLCIKKKNFQNFSFVMFS